MDWRDNAKEWAFAFAMGLLGAAFMMGLLYLRTGHLIP